MCLEPSCKQFWKLNKRAPPKKLSYDPLFLAERTEWPRAMRPSFDLVPDLYSIGEEASLGGAYARGAWKGFCCPQCHRCNFRRLWHLWKCETPSCRFEYRISQPALSPRAVLGDHETVYSGHAFYQNECSDPTIGHKTSVLGQYRVDTYDLGGGNTVTHMMANKWINGAAGGPDDMFLKMQKEQDLGLQRFSMGGKTGRHETLVQHFSVNFGMPYVYVVATESRPFADAPSYVMNAVQRCTWAGQTVIKDGSFRDYNELLAVGYFTGGKMSFHDDGEATVGENIATLSLGGSAKMEFRMKDKYLTGLSKRGQYQPKLDVYPNAWLAKERKALNAQHESGALDQADLDRRVKEMYKRAGRRPTSKVFLALKLMHGDLVVMNGPDLQKGYEHQVTPDGKVRFALTCRFIKPEAIDPAVHWKGDFDASKGRYDGARDGMPAAEEERAMGGEVTISDRPAVREDGGGDEEAPGPRLEPDVGVESERDSSPLSDLPDDVEMDDSASQAETVILEHVALVLEARPQSMLQATIVDMMGSDAEDESESEEKEEKEEEKEKETVEVGEMQYLPSAPGLHKVVEMCDATIEAVEEGTAGGMA